MFERSLHKVVDGINYGVCIDKLTQRLEAKISSNRPAGGSREYPTVLAMSKDPEALLRVHAQQISQDQARQIVYAYLDECECPALDFTATTMRGRAWGNGRIRLPQKPTMGLVLHEVAHIIQHNDRGFKRLGSGKRDVHGADFVRILDGLVRSEGLASFE